MEILPPEMDETLTEAVLSPLHKASVDVARTLIGACAAETVTSSSVIHPFPSLTETLYVPN